MPLLQKHSTPSKLSMFFTAPAFAAGFGLVASGIGIHHILTLRHLSMHHHTCAGNTFSAQSCWSWEQCL